MKTGTFLKGVASTCVLILWATGCATDKSTEHFPTKYNTTDSRVAEVGPRKRTDDGWTFKEPHMNKCWIAADFDFTGYDTLYLAPTLSEVTGQDEDARRMIEISKDAVVVEYSRLFRVRNLFANVVTSETNIPPGAHVLKLEQTIIEFQKGSAGARIWAGEFGAGQPVLALAGKMTDGGKPVFTYEARRSGTSAGARLAIMRSDDIQIQDIRSMALDVSDFVAVIAGKYTPRN